MQEWETAARIFQGFATPILIAIGGIFAWYKFIRQGEHDPILQPAVTSEVTIRDDVAYIVATVSAFNAGQVDVVLNLEASGLLMLGREANSGWKDLETRYGVFPGQTRVQPGLTLEDQVWIEFEYQDDVAACLELTISEKDGRTWRTVEVVSLLDGGKRPPGG